MILLQTSRFVEKKGVDLSIRAFADVRRRLPRAELWLVGDGPLRAELESLAVDLDVSDAVRFMGALSHARYRELLVDVDLCLQPSRTTSDGDTEGGAPTLLEMQASGIPVVSTRHADIPSVVPFDDALAAEEDVAGIAAAIVRLAEEADTAWLRRAEVGRRYVENEHDARKISQLVERHYDEALQQPAFRSARLDSVEAVDDRKNITQKLPRLRATANRRRGHRRGGRLASLGLDWHGPQGAPLRAATRGLSPRSSRPMRLSCTAALMLGMKVLGIQPGDEVIVPSMTFVASANAVVHAGGIPVLVDSEPGTCLIDLDAVEAAITDQTRAIMPVHFAGRPVDMDRLNALRDRHGLLVIEDAAHAIGTEWRGTRIGGHGNLAAYSFYVTKNLTTGEGGALSTTDQNIAEEVERLALHGLSLGAWQRFSDSGFKHYEVDEPGFKFNMMDLQAALGLHQLPRLDRWIEERARLWHRYDELLADLPLETPPLPAADSVHSRHLYYVLVSPDAPISRDTLVERLVEHRIGTGVHYRAVHLHRYYRERFDIDPASLPVSTDISNRTLSAP